MSDEEPTPVVSCDAVSRVYNRPDSRFVAGSGEPITALSDVSLTVGKGEVVGLAGPSGSGKSTLLHLVAGLDTPTSGSISLDGTNLQDLSTKQLTKYRLNNIGLVFQRFYLLPSLSTRSNVALPLVEQGQSRRKRRARADKLLEQVGLSERASHRPSALSGGEQQRVAIARALATEPSLIVADEPTGELDTETGETVLDALLAERDSRATLIASHDKQTLERTDRVINLVDGSRVE